MKLNEIKGDKVLTVIAELMPPIANIATDKNSANAVNKLRDKETRLEVLKSELPSLIKNHKKDLITILALLNDVSYKEYKDNMTLVSLLNDLFSLLTDDMINDLFTSAQTQKQEESYGDAQVTSKEEQ